MRQQKTLEHIYSLYKKFLVLGVGMYEFFPYGKQEIVTRGPRIVQFILSTEADKFSNGTAREFSVPITGKRIINSDGEEWLKGRKSTTPTFTKSHIADRDFWVDFHEMVKL